MWLEQLRIQLWPHKYLKIQSFFLSVHYWLEQQWIQLWPAAITCLLYNLHIYIVRCRLYRRQAVAAGHSWVLYFLFIGKFNGPCSWQLSSRLSCSISLMSEISATFNFMLLPSCHMTCSTMLEYKQIYKSPRPTLFCMFHEWCTVHRLRFADKSVVEINVHDLWNIYIYIYI